MPLNIINPAKPAGFIVRYRVLFKSENSRHRDACFSKVLVCLFKVQKRLSFSSWIESFLKSGAKVLLFFYICKFFYMFLNIFCKIDFTKRLFTFYFNHFKVFYFLFIDGKPQ